MTDLEIRNTNAQVTIAAEDHDVESGGYDSTLVEFTVNISADGEHGGYGEWKNPSSEIVKRKTYEAGALPEEIQQTVEEHLP